MTDEVIEGAVARAIREARNEAMGRTTPYPDHFKHYREARAAISAHKSALTKAGLGIRPREATKKMVDGLGTGQLKNSYVLKATYDAMCIKVYKAMWDAYPDKPNG